MSICRAEELLGLPLTHNSRHVASTFKRLINTTTHCGLNKFYQHRWISTMKLVTQSVYGSYSDCKKVNNQLL